MSDLAAAEWFGVMATKRRRVAGSYVLKKQADARKSVELSGASQPREVALVEQDPQTGVTPGVGSVPGSIPGCR